MTEYENTETVAKILAITPRRVRGLASEGIIPKAGRGKYELELVVPAYIRYIKVSLEQGGTDYLSARARSELARAAKMEMELAVYKREYAPIDLIEHVLERASSAAAARLDSITSRLHQKYPDMKRKHLDAVRKEIAKARNSLAELKPELN